MTPAEHIIVPLDVPEGSAAIALVDQLPQVTFWKVGLELFVSSGPALIQQLKDRHKRIFLDLKISRYSQHDGWCLSGCGPLWR